MTNRLELPREGRFASNAAAALALIGAFGSGHGAVGPWCFGAIAVWAALRGGALPLAIACALPAIGRVVAIPDATRALGIVPAASSFVAILAIDAHARADGERPAGRGPSRGLALALAGGLATVALRRMVALLAPHGESLWLPFEVLPIAAVVMAIGRSPRATRGLRDRLRSAVLWGVAAAMANDAPTAPDEAGPVALLAFVAVEGFGIVPGAGGVAALAVAVLLRAVRALPIPHELVVVVAVLLGAATRTLGTLAFPGLGARFRLLARTRARFASHEGVHTHRVALALAEPVARFVLDWHRPAVQLIVDRVGMLRVGPALPAPELEAALEAAPGEVLAVAEVHPYLVGAVDVHAALRSLAVRDAAAAALVRDAESGDVSGVLYLVGGTHAPLAEEEARLLVALARAVGASLGAGTDPAIAARLRG